MVHGTLGYPDFRKRRHTAIDKPFVMNNIATLYFYYFLIFLLEKYFKVIDQLRITGPNRYMNLYHVFLHGPWATCMQSMSARLLCCLSSPVICILQY